MTALLDRALEIASVSGTLSPQQIAEAAGLTGDEAQLRHELWAGLAPQVAEILPGRADAGGEDAAYGWRLNPDARRVRLQGFVTRSGLDRALRDAPSPRPGDLFGAALRRVLSGETRLQPVRAHESDAELLHQIERTAALLDAVQFAHVVPALRDAGFAGFETALKREIQRLQRRRDLAIVLPRPHRGYERQRSRISAFLRGKVKDGRPVLLTGIGGSGKSALLARIFSGWQGRRGAPVPIVLDFDRRQLAAGEPVEILHEFLRQLAAGIGRNMPDDALAPVRGELGRMRSELPKFTSTGSARDHESQFSFLASVTLDNFSQPWAAPLRDLPLAMLFDSFEAVDRGGEGEIVEVILRLETALRNVLPRLRTVVSGRAEPLDKALLDQHFGPERRQIVLAGLSPKNGARLLAEECVRLGGESIPDEMREPEICERVSRLLGGHPLALLIFAQHVTSAAVDVPELIADLENDPGFQAEFAQRFLYDRILERIPDPELRDLAHPGLVLRTLNADLLRFVLAGPCLGRPPEGENPVTPAEADEMLARMSHQYWLVDPAPPPFRLRHRADLRRLMLVGLFAGAVEADDPSAGRKNDLSRKARDVCRAARSYFQDGPTAAAGPEARAAWEAIDAETRRVHATYYQAFLQPDAPPDIDVGYARTLELRLREDLGTLPIAWRALIRALGGRLTTPEEERTLPEAPRKQQEALRFEARSQRGTRGRTQKRREASPAEEVTPTPASYSDAVPPLDKADMLSVTGLSYRPTSMDLSDVTIVPAPRHPEPDADADPEELEREILHLYAANEFSRIAPLFRRYTELLLKRTDAEALSRFRTGEREGFWTRPLWKCLLLAGTSAFSAEPELEEALLLTRGVSPEGHPYAGVLGAIGHAVAYAKERQWSVTPTDTASADQLRWALIDVFERNLDDPVDFNRARWGLGVEREIELRCEALSLAGASWWDREGETPSILTHALPGGVADLLRSFLGTPDAGLIEFAAVYKEIGGHPTARFPIAGPPMEVPGYRRMLRGLNPELQEPLVTMFERRDAAQAVDITRIVAEAAALWPHELRFGEKTRYEPYHARLVVETADQCGVLRELAAALTDYEPAAATVVEMFDAISGWFFPFVTMSVEDLERRG